MTPDVDQFVADVVAAIERARAVGPRCLIDEIHLLARVVQTLGLDVADRIAKGANLPEDEAFCAAMEATLNVLPPPKSARR